MIILTNQDINTLIKQYLYDEKYYHTYFSFVNEAECTDGGVRYALKELLLKGLQFTYLEDCGQTGGARECVVVMGRDEKYFMGKCGGVVRDGGNDDGGIEGIGRANEREVSEGSNENNESGGNNENNENGGNNESGGNDENNDEKVNDKNNDDNTGNTTNNKINKEIMNEQLKHGIIRNIRLKDCMPLIAFTNDEMVVAYGGMIEINRRKNTAGGDFEMIGNKGGGTKNERENKTGEVENDKEGDIERKDKNERENTAQITSNEQTVTNEENSIKSNASHESIRTSDTPVNIPGAEHKNTVIPRTATLSDQYVPIRTHRVNDVITAIASAPTGVYYGTLSGSVLAHTRTYRMTRAPVLSVKVRDGLVVCADSDGVLGVCRLDGRDGRVYKVFEGGCYEVEPLEGGYVCGSENGEVVFVSDEKGEGGDDEGEGGNDEGEGGNDNDKNRRDKSNDKDKGKSNDRDNINDNVDDNSVNDNNVNTTLNDINPAFNNNINSPAFKNVNNHQNFNNTVKTPNTVKLLYKHKLSVNHLTATLSHITSSSADHTTTITSTQSSTSHTYNDHTASVNAHLHHNRLYTVSTDTQMLVYDNERLVERYVHDGPVYAMGYGEWYGLIGTGTLGKCVYFYDGRVGLVDRVCVGMGVREMVFGGWVVGYCGVEGGVGAVDVRMMYKGGY